MIFTLWLGLFIRTTQAQVVFAPYSPDRPLVNPAAGATRAYQAYYLKLGHQVEDSEVKGLINSQLKTETTVDRLDFQSSLNFGKNHLELTFAPQFGKRHTDSGSTGTVQSTDDELKLNTSQFTLGREFYEFLSLGFKFLSSHSNFDSNNKYKYSTATQNYDSNGKSEIKTKMTILGVGAVIDIPKTGIFIGLGLENVDLKKRIDINGSGTVTGTGGNPSNTTTTENGVFSSKTSVKKRSYGGGILWGKPKGNSLKLEVSREIMPPLAKGTGLLDGTLQRYSGEMTYLKYRLGVEWKKTSGYYVDPLNLVPYFFNIERMSNAAKGDLSFYGGFKLNSGTTVGASISWAKEKTQEALSNYNGAGGEKNEVVRTTKAIGVNFGYLF